jgi:hypothetical protein
MVGLPHESIFQGRVYAGDDDEHESYHGISVKFPVDDDLFIHKNPDIEFAGKFITRMSIRMTNEVSITDIRGGLQAGEHVIVRRSKVWSFLEDMGYVEVIGIPGELVELVGSSARDAFLFSVEPPLREVVVLSDLDAQQLAAVGCLETDGSGFYSSPEKDIASHFDVNTRSWRYRKYVDLDDPKSAGFYGRSRDWVNEGVSNCRSSLSPEPAGLELDY